MFARYRRVISIKLLHESAAIRKRVVIKVLSGDKECVLKRKL